MPIQPKYSRQQDTYEQNKIIWTIVKFLWYSSIAQIYDNGV